MKKVLISLFSAVATVTLMASTFAVTTSDNYNSQKHSQHDCTYHIGMYGGECPSCGGVTEWKANAYYVKIKCVACNGTGTLSSGEYKTRCTTCNGTGKIDMPKSGYVCKRCKRVFKD